MARRPVSSPAPTPAQPPLALAVPRAEAARRIGDRIEIGKEWQEKLNTMRFGPERISCQHKAIEWDEYNEELLKRLFTNTSISDEYNTAVFAVMALDEAQVAENFRRTHALRIAKLESISARLDLYPEPSTEAEHIEPPGDSFDKSKVFIVHGHDDGSREGVARLLERLGLRPIILHEQANRGRTIITKFQEEASGAGFAVVLMTPDDVGGVSADKLKARARQNVVFELGFFIGKLGPDRVAALVKGDIEKPSDFDGVVYISLDDGYWKLRLAQELKAAGYEIDLNRAMG